MKPRLASWETIQKEYPDRFVLLTDTVFEPEPYIKEAMVLYRHYHKKKVVDKYLELKPKGHFIVYTGGKRLDLLDENTLLI